MTGKLCASNCLYAIDGHCRLEHRHGERTPICPHYVYDLLA
ncbi:MAG TPA: cleavage protein [Desulfitobacteriaceae bacterium]|nr:cleavage protein [Desulfitobacteriaceae bacterium]